MELKPGFFQYKCRRCGVIFDGVHGGRDLDLALIELMIHGKSISKPGAMVTMQTFHRCKTEPEGIGIADCIGVEFKSETED